MCANNHDCGKVHKKIASGSKLRAYYEIYNLSKTMSLEELKVELKKKIDELKE